MSNYNETKECSKIQMKRYYVYELIDQETQSVFYVGKGTGNRMYTHERLSLSESHYNKELQSTILRILKNGQNVEYIISLETDDFKEAYDFEFERIKSIGINNLCNIQSSAKYNKSVSTGLENWYNSEYGMEIRSKRKRAMKENNPMYSKELKQKWSERNKGGGNFFHSLSDESKEKHRRNVSKSKMGAGNPRSKPVIYLPTGQTYGSRNEMLRELNTTIYKIKGMWEWIPSKNRKF